jgi:hypothetical protein
MEYIQGEKFMALANGENILYCDTHNISSFLRDFPKRTIILITHNSDCKIDDNIEIPDNISRWFAQNVNKVDSRLESLPIGLENNKWFKKVNKLEKIVQKLETTRNLRNLVYINHNKGTNIKERCKPYKLLEKVPWATLKEGLNGKDFDGYLDDIYNHNFVICPQGNGIDTHRTWEVLYVGSIPIERRNINNQYYTDLPICFVNDWEEVTEDFLVSEYIRIKTSVWNMAKLDFNYWKERIESYAA